MQSLVEKAEEYYTRKEMNDLNETFEKKWINDLCKKISNLRKEFRMIKGSEKTLKNNEIKHIMKVIRSLEIEEVSWKELSKKLLVKNEDFSILDQLIYH